MIRRLIGPSILGLFFAFFGSQVVHNIYQPLADLDDLVAKRKEEILAELLSSEGKQDDPRRQ